MKAFEIRNVLEAEANHLSDASKGNNSYAGRALMSFANTATDQELFRFRELLTGLPEFKLPHTAA